MSASRYRIVSIVVFAAMSGRAAIVFPDAPRTSEGVQAFQNHRWLDSMAYFLDVLRHDPKNLEAHKYIPLAVHEIEAQNHAVIRELRLGMLSESSHRLEANRQDAYP